MLTAMMAAEVGDDVYGEDPTVNRLEERVAAELGTEAAIFVPSGTMANQIAVRLHCPPGSELLCDSTSHVYLWEGGAPAALSGVTTRMIDGNLGVLTVQDLEGKLHPPDDIHSPTSRLVCLENTHNRGGGRVYPIEQVREVSAWARKHGLAMHLDGARLWNAVVASGVPSKEWCRHFDTVSVCFSKGLGAPVGSALAGPRELIRRARRIRKLFGGAMRQAGYLAAAAQYALDHNVERLAEDHANAKLLAEAVAEVRGLKLISPQVESNLVWFEAAEEIGGPRAVAAHLRENGILVSPLGDGVVRAVTHLDVSRSDCERAAGVIRRFARNS
jgi:threonine aldolase